MKSRWGGFWMGAVKWVLCNSISVRVLESRWGSGAGGVISYSLLFNFLLVTKFFFLPHLPHLVKKEIRGNRDAKLGAFGGVIGWGRNWFYPICTPTWLFHPTRKRRNYLPLNNCV